MTETTPDRIHLLIRNALISFAGLMGLIVLVRLAFIRTYNYDELSHAHMAWLVSVGEVPYRDFAINHFPFFWILVCPLIKILPQSPAAMMALRGVAMLFNAIFVSALGTLICLQVNPRQRIWALGCFGIAIFSPLSIHYLIEFRPDSVANALLFSTLAWLGLRGMKNAPAAFASGFCIGAAILINTKYVMFPLILGGITIVTHARRIRQMWPLAACVCMGFCSAMLYGMILLSSIHVSLADAWRMVVTYNAMVEKAHTFGFGLAHTIIQKPIFLTYCLLGIVGCTFLFLHERKMPGTFSISILLFLMLNLFTTTRPWKQYAASWFILASYFPSLFMSHIATGVNPKKQLAFASCILMAVFLQIGGINTLDPSGAGEVSRATQDQIITLVCRDVAPDGFVVASFPLHPVFRRDTFFKVVIDMTAQGDDGFEKFMLGLTSPPYREHFQKPGYEQELEFRPPSLIIRPSLYTESQIDALDTYLKNNPERYHPYLIQGTPITLLERSNGLP